MSKTIMKNFFAKLKTEDWVIVIAGMVILLLSIFLGEYVPRMPKTLATGDNWLMAGYMFAFLYFLIILTSLALGKNIKGVLLSLFVIFGIALLSQVIANIPVMKKYGLESVLFAVTLGLLISNLGKVPSWLKPAIQSEFYIKIGIICLGSTILFGEVLKSGVLGLAQSVVVVLSVWYLAFWIARKKYKVDDEMSTMLASAVSICGVSAAIATSGVIQGDNKKLSYIISLVLVVAVPMMYLMPWLANVMGLSEEVAGAWLGGTIDTTGAVAASGTMLGETAAQTAIIVKSSQNVLLGVAAFMISLFWSYRGQNKEQRPTGRVIWDRFPKFVLGFIIASLIFSFCMPTATAKAIGSITKGMSNTLFSVAFVCIGLETRFKDIFSRENRKALKAFLAAQGLNIVITLIVAYVLFGLIGGSMR